MIVAKTTEKTTCGFYYKFYDHRTLSHHYHKIITSQNFAEQAIITSLSHIITFATAKWRQFPDQVSANAREFSPLRCEMTALMGLFLCFGAQSSDGMADVQKGRSMTIRF
jgi:hypothetical protein